MRVLRDSMGAWAWTDTRMTGDLRIERNETRKTGLNEDSSHFPETRMAITIRSAKETIARMELAVVEMSLPGSKTTLMLLLYQENVTAMVTDCPIVAEEDGETKTAKTEAREQNEENEATAVGIGIGISVKNVSPNGWPNPRRRRTRLILKRTFKSGKNKCKGRISPRHLLRSPQ
jgi:hypothetical protein